MTLSVPSPEVMASPNGLFVLTRPTLQLFDRYLSRKTLVHGIAAVTSPLIRHKRRRFRKEAEAMALDVIMLGRESMSFSDIRMSIRVCVFDGEDGQDAGGMSTEQVQHL